MTQSLLTIYGVSPADLNNAMLITKAFMESLDCIELKTCEIENGTFNVSFKHKWSIVRFIAEGIKQFFKNDYRPGLDVWRALQDHLAAHGYNSRLEER